MQREISDKVSLGGTINLYACVSSAIDRTASNYNNAKEKVNKIRELFSASRFDKDIAKIHFRTACA